MSSINYNLHQHSTKSLFQANLEYIQQINSELDQLMRLRDLLQHGGGRISLVNNDEIVIHPNPRVDVTDTWNGLPGL